MHRWRLRKPNPAMARGCDLENDADPAIARHFANARTLSVEIRR
jgi:hypothetical protein